MKNTYWLEYAYARLEREGLVQKPFQLEPQESSKGMDLEGMVLDNIPLLSKEDIRRKIGKKVPQRDIRQEFGKVGLNACIGEYPFQVYGQLHRQRREGTTWITDLKRIIFPLINRGKRSSYRAISAIFLEGRERVSVSQEQVFYAGMVAGMDRIQCCTLYWDNIFMRRTAQKKDAIHIAEILHEAIEEDEVDLFKTKGSSREEQRADLNLLREHPSAYIDAVIDLARECVPWRKT